jgi:hypothetical protein
LALSYKDSIVIEIRNEENTQENIDQAKLLEKYIREYKKDIELLENRYAITDSFVLSTYKKELDSMVRALRKTETIFIEKSDAEAIRIDIVASLKEINIFIKELLKKEQVRFENRVQTTKNMYIKIGIKISGVIVNLTQNITATLSKKDTLSSYEKDIVRSLVRLSKVNDTIREFASRDFETQDEMKLYYTDIIRKIRIEISLIKTLLKSS